MPQHHPDPSPADSLRDRIALDAEYVVQILNDSAWMRPTDAEYRTLTGLDIWHAVRRARRVHRAAADVTHDGIVTLSVSTAKTRFIPTEVYEKSFRSAEDSEKPPAAAERRSGSSAEHACTAEEHGDAAFDDAGTSPAGARVHSSSPAPAPPYTDADLRMAAEAVYRSLFLALDPDSGVGESIGDLPIPGTAGASTRTWQSLGREGASAAYRAIWHLLDTAPDLACWAIGMAAEHLVPDPTALTRWQDDTASVRIHVAFADDVTPNQRRAIHDAVRLVLRADL